MEDQMKRRIPQSIVIALFTLSFLIFGCTEDTSHDITRGDAENFYILVSNALWNFVYIDLATNVDRLYENTAVKSTTFYEYTPIVDSTPPTYAITGGPIRSSTEYLKATGQMSYDGVNYVLNSEVIFFQFSNQETLSEEPDYIINPTTRLEGSGTLQFDFEGNYTQYIYSVYGDLYAHGQFTGDVHLDFAVSQTSSETSYAGTIAGYEVARIMGY
jgi:hypothetical protein